MANDHSHGESHVSEGELTRTIAGFTKAMEIGFNGVNTRLEDTGRRVENVERAVNDLTRTSGGHRAEIDNIYRRLGKPASSPSFSPVAVVDDAKPVLTYGEFRRLTLSLTWIGKAIWPVVYTAGGALATWLAANWPG